MNPARLLLGLAIGRRLPIVAGSLTVGRRGRQWPLNRIFNIGPVPYGSDTNTVAQAAVDPFDPLADPLVMPSPRCACSRQAGG